MTMNRRRFGQTALAAGAAALAAPWVRPARAAGDAARLGVLLSLVWLL